MNAKKSSGPIELQRLERRTFVAYIMGETPLIMHAWSQKAIIEMLAKQMGQKVPRFPKHPVQDFLDSIYHMQDGHYGFPATAIKSSMVECCTSMSKEITKKAAEQALYIPSGRGTAISAFSGQPVPIQLVPVWSPCAPAMREDMVRVGMGTADLRYRAEFFPWAMKLTVIFNAKAVSQTTVANLIDTAGFACGLGEWRQEKGGVNGQFRLATPKEQKDIDKWAKKRPVDPTITADAERAFLQRLQDSIKTYGELLGDSTEDARKSGRNGAAKEMRQ